MKFCPGCHEEKPLNEFARNKARYDGLQSHCRKCKSNHDHSYYSRNKELHYSRVKTYLLQNRQRLWEYLLKHHCVDCSENNPVVLEFDHLGGKIATISWMLRQRRSWSTIETEIIKCQVRCANCHRMKTAKELGWYKDIRR